jgi:hypothetical protein
MNTLKIMIALCLSAVAAQGCIINVDVGHGYMKENTGIGAPIPTSDLAGQVRLDIHFSGRVQILPSYALMQVFFVSNTSNPLNITIKETLLNQFFKPMGELQATLPVNGVDGKNIIFGGGFFPNFALGNPPLDFYGVRFTFKLPKGVGVTRGDFGLGSGNGVFHNVFLGNVPDAGSTLCLLSLSLGGLAWLKSRS